MQTAALGFRAHSGWTAAVAVSLSNGGPSVLDRRRVHLVETFTYEFRQPYHTAERMPLPQATKFISRIQDEADRLALAALRSVQSDLREKGYKLTRFGLLLSSGRPLPALEQTLASHALIHTADGELFRNALAYAAERCRLPLTRIKERELPEHATKTLRIRPADLTRRLSDLGRPLGPPWSQDEKLSALIAWLSLASV